MTLVRRLIEICTLVNHPGHVGVQW